jgi:hypothetical protein
MPKLGTLKRVEDLRGVWKHEGRDFTPWLRDNIDLLAETIGLELDLIESESPVGNYAVDIYAKDLNTGRWVIIENQLEQTDHSHLGQVMAYAAGKEAGVVIWVATEFRDEHRQTLDWLNEITGEHVSFFGIELELLQVDDSLPAVHLKLVVEPNEWQKALSRPATSPRQQAYQEFFGELVGKVKDKHPGLTKATRGYPQNWFSFPVGRSGFSIAAVFGQHAEFRVELYIDTGDQDKNKASFDALYEDRENIEAAIGQSLVWERLDEKRASRIYCATEGSINDTESRLQELQDWAVELVWTFNEVFRPRLADLPA